MKVFSIREFRLRISIQGYLSRRFLSWTIFMVKYLNTARHLFTVNGVSLQSMTSRYSQWRLVTVNQIFPVSATTLNAHDRHPKTVYVNLHFLTPQHVDYAQVLDSTIRASPPHPTRPHLPVSSLRSATNSATGAQHAQSPSKMTTWK